MSDTLGRTTRLELHDQALREWEAVVLDAGPDGVVLDRSAFYPGGGGQPRTTASCSGRASRPASPASARATTSS